MKLKINFERKQFRVLFPLIVSVFLLAGLARGDQFEIGFDSWSYFHNLEFVGSATEYRPGETFFGQHLSIFGTYRSSQHFYLRGGVFLGRSFGDEDPLSEVRPLISAHYEPNEHFALRFGDLDRSGRIFKEAIFDDILLYKRPLETGFQINAGLDWFELATWINWQALNTEEHREKFDVGVVTGASWKSLRLDYQLHVIHHGGQQFSPGPVTDDLSTTLGLRMEKPFWIFDRISGGAAGYYSRYSIRDTGEKFSGDGIEFEVYVQKAGWKPFFSYWRGDDFWTADGDPFYQADSLARFGFDKHWKISPNMSIGLGFVGYYLENEFQHSEYLELRLNGGAVLKKWH